MLSIHLYSIKIKILYSVFCNPQLQNEASPTYRNQYTLFRPVKLLKEVFEGLTLLTPKLTILMKILNIKTPFIFRCFGSIQKASFSLL